MEGVGIFRYANGDSFEGTFLKGTRYGQGKYTYRDGGYYQGEYRNLMPMSRSRNAAQLPLCDGKRHGTGIRVWTNGARYEGQWLNDKIHGQGMLISEDGAKFEGYFYNGLK